MYPVCESSPESMGFACAVTLASCQSCCGSFLKSLVVDLYWQWCQKIGLRALLPNRIPETRTLSEIERKSFIALPGAQGIPVSKTVFPSPGDLLKSFVGVVQGWSCWYRLGCVQGVEIRWPCWTVSFVLNLPDHRVTFRGLLRCKSPCSLQIWVQRFFTAAHPTPPPPASFYNQASLGNTDPDEILATGDPVWAISSSSSTTTKRIEVLKTWAPWERKSGEIVEDPGASLRRHHVNGRSRDGEKRGSRSDHREYSFQHTCHPASAFKN